MPYDPSEFPAIETLDELRNAVVEEFKRVAQALAETTALDLRPIFDEPTRPRDGLIVYADGVEWDPGAGEGVYAMENGAWVKL